MAAGDVVNPQRVQFSANERVDLVDVDAETSEARRFWDAGTRALLFAPPATPGAPVGMILTGASVLVNPTGAGDGKLRIQSELLVALDSDGRYLIKPAGTTIDAAVGAGGAQYQIYVYFVDVSGVPGKRRKIPVTPPFTEFTAVPDTAFLSGISVYVKLGGPGSIAATDVVNGVNVNLAFLGIATNTAGTVAFDPSTATNRLSTVSSFSRPASSSANGGFRTVHGQVKQALYEGARTRYQDQGGFSGAAASAVAGAGGARIRISGLVNMAASMVGQVLELSGVASAANGGHFPIMAFVNGTTVDVYNPHGVVGDANNGAIAWALFAHSLPGTGSAPQASNNYGAYVEPRRSLDLVDRSAPSVVTIGDGSSRFGTFDTSEFSDGSACLQAALNYICSRGGGTLVIEQGVTVTLVADVTIPDGSPIAIGGAGGILQCGAFKVSTTLGILALRDLKILCTATAIFPSGGFLADNVTFVVSGAASGPAILYNASGFFGGSFRVSGCTFQISASAPDAATTFAAISVPVGLPGGTIVVESTLFQVTGAARSVCSINLNGQSVDVHVFGCSFAFLTSASPFGTQPDFLSISGANGANGVHVSGCTFDGDSNFQGVHLSDVTGASVVDCAFRDVTVGLTTSGSTAVNDLRVTGCKFLNSGFVVSSTGSVGTVGKPGLTAVGNAFTATVDGVLAPFVSASTTSGVASVVWQGNRHDGYFAAGGYGWFGLKIVSDEVDAVISGNKFSNLQSNLAYAGGIGAGRVIEIDARAHSWAVTGNFADQIGASQTGANAAALFFLDAASKLRSTDAATSLFACSLASNVVGDGSSNVTLFSGAASTGGLSIFNLSIHGNVHQSSPALGGEGLLILLSGNTNRALSIQDNVWEIPTNGGVSSWFSLLGSAVIACLTLVGNVVTVGGAALSSGSGLTCAWNVCNLVFFLNSAGIPNDTTTNPIIYTTFSGTVSSSVPASPGSGINWSNNIHVRNV